MKNAFLLKFTVVLSLFLMSAGAIYADKLYGIRWDKGVRVPDDQEGGPLFHCDYHPYNICNAAPATDGPTGGTFVMGDLYTTPVTNHLRVQFLTPWGYPNFMVTYPVELPPAVAAYFGYSNIYVVPANYPVITNAAYPNGYVDIVVTP